MGDAPETSKTLRNWMGEPRPSDQGDDEETLQLSLGLPGGGGGGATGAGLPPAAAWRMLSAREKEMRSAAAAAAVDTSMLSLGYSAPAFSPRSPGTPSTVPIGHGCYHVCTILFFGSWSYNRKKNVPGILDHHTATLTSLSSNIPVKC